MNAHTPYRRGRDSGQYAATPELPGLRGVVRDDADAWHPPACVQCQTPQDAQRYTHAVHPGPRHAAAVAHTDEKRRTDMHGAAARPAVSFCLPGRADVDGTSVDRCMADVAPLLCTMPPTPAVLLRSSRAWCGDVAARSCRVPAAPASDALPSTPGVTGRGIDLRCAPCDPAAASKTTCATTENAGSRRRDSSPEVPTSEIVAVSTISSILCTPTAYPGDTVLPTPLVMGGGPRGAAGCGAASPSSSPGAAIVAATYETPARPAMSVLAVATASKTCPGVQTPAHGVVLQTPIVMGGARDAAADGAYDHPNRGGTISPLHGGNDTPAHSGLSVLAAPTARETGRAVVTPCARDGVPQTPRVMGVRHSWADALASAREPLLSVLAVPTAPQATPRGGGLRGAHGDGNQSDRNVCVLATPGHSPVLIQPEPPSVSPPPADGRHAGVERGSPVVARDGASQPPPSLTYIPTQMLAACAHPVIQNARSAEVLGVADVAEDAAVFDVQMESPVAMDAPCIFVEDADGGMGGGGEGELQSAPSLTYVPTQMLPEGADAVKRARSPGTGGVTAARDVAVESGAGVDVGCIFIEDADEDMGVGMDGGGEPTARPSLTYVPTQMLPVGACEIGGRLVDLRLEDADEGLAADVIDSGPRRVVGPPVLDRRGTAVGTAEVGCNTPREGSRPRTCPKTPSIGGVVAAATLDTDRTPLDLAAAGHDGGATPPPPRSATPDPSLSDAASALAVGVDIAIGTVTPPRGRSSAAHDGARTGRGPTTPTSVHAAVEAPRGRVPNDAERTPPRVAAALLADDCVAGHDGGDARTLLPLAAPGPSSREVASVLAVGVDAITPPRQHAVADQMDVGPSAPANTRVGFTTAPQPHLLSEKPGVDARRTQQRPSTMGPCPGAHAPACLSAATIGDGVDIDGAMSCRFYGGVAATPQPQSQTSTSSDSTLTYVPDSCGGEVGRALLGTPAAEGGTAATDDLAQGVVTADMANHAHALLREALEFPTQDVDVDTDALEDAAVSGSGVPATSAQPPARSAAGESINSTLVISDDNTVAPALPCQTRNLFTFDTAFPTQDVDANVAFQECQASVGHKAAHGDKVPVPAIMEDNTAFNVDAAFPTQNVDADLAFEESVGGLASVGKASGGGALDMRVPRGHVHPQLGRHTGDAAQRQHEAAWGLCRVDNRGDRDAMSTCTPPSKRRRVQAAAPPPRPSTGRDAGCCGDARTGSTAAAQGGGAYYYPRGAATPKFETPDVDRWVTFEESIMQLSGTCGRGHAGGAATLPPSKRRRVADAAPLHRLAPPGRCARPSVASRTPAAVAAAGGGRGGRASLRARGGIPGALVDTPKFETPDVDRWVTFEESIMQLSVRRGGGGRVAAVPGATAATGGAAPRPLPRRSKAHRTPVSAVFRRLRASQRFETPDVDSLVEFEDTLQDTLTPASAADAHARALRAMTAGFVGKRDAAMQHWVPGGDRDYLVARDAGSDGSKLFLAVPRGAVAELVLGVAPDARCFYSVIPPDVPVDVYLDIDYKYTADDPPVMRAAAYREAVLSYVLRLLIHALHHVFDAALHRVLVLSACTPVKLSYHVHAALAGNKAFPNTAVLQAFLREVFNPAAPSAPEGWEEWVAAYLAGGDGHGSQGEREVHDTPAAGTAARAGHGSVMGDGQVVPEEGGPGDGGRCDGHHGGATRPPAVVDGRGGRGCADPDVDLFAEEEEADEEDGGAGKTRGGTSMEVHVGVPGAAPEGASVGGRIASGRGEATAAAARASDTFRNLPRAACAAIDKAPYSKFCCFRLPYCKKKGKQNPLTPIDVDAVTSPLLAAILRRYAAAASAPAGQAMTERSVIAQCLITQVGGREVSTLDATALGSAGGGQGVKAKRTRCVDPTFALRRAAAAALANSTVGAGAVPDYLQRACLAIYHSLAPEYRVLALADLSFKPFRGGGCVASQKKTTWCIQARRCHEHATTSIMVWSGRTAVSCWSANCPKKVIFENNIEVLSPPSGGGEG